MEVLGLRSDLRSRTKTLDVHANLSTSSDALFPFRSAALLEPVALSRYLPMARGEDAAGIMIYQRDRPALEIPIA